MTSFLKPRSPCLVIAQLRAACTNASYTLPAIDAGYHYASNGVCTCNIPVYNLESACGVEVYSFKISGVSG